MRGAHSTKGSGIKKRSWLPRKSTLLRGAGCTCLLLFAAVGVAQDFSVEWWTVDGGGEVFSETADQQWQLSGTIGQWDSTAPEAMAGGGWILTSGFWPRSVEKPEIIFADGFED
jgi:hypothetical protein